LASAQSFKALSRFFVHAISDSVSAHFIVDGLVESREEVLRAPLLHLLPRGAANGRIGGDEADGLARSVLRRQPLEERVGMLRVTDLEWPVHLLLPVAVEDDYAPGAVQRDEARQAIDEFAAILEGPGVQKVVPIE
jgi:hypothetical protein